MKDFKLKIFGKEGCDKCKLLKKRIGKLLKKEEWDDFEQEYYDVKTVEGIVQFSRAECLNPQRIPAVMVFRNEGDEYRRIPETFKEGFSEEHGTYRYPTYLHIETDYSNGGVIRRSDITDLFQKARDVSAS